MTLDRVVEEAGAGCLAYNKMDEADHHGASCPQREHNREEEVEQN
jgi:hypothetical protein